MPPTTNSPHGNPRDNFLLAGLPDETYERFQAELRPLELAEGMMLSHSGRSPERFHFITAGLVSLLYHTIDGHSAELALVGNEGGAGLSGVMSGQAYPAEEVVQVEGFAWSLGIDALHDEFSRGGTMQSNLLHFNHSLMTQVAHTAVCNRHHSIEQQLVRWLLMSLDRLGVDELLMTQETIAHMLGVRRAGVTEAAGRLQRAGTIRYLRGHIQVTDRAALEEHACECYQAIEDEYMELRRAVLANGSVRRGADARPRTRTRRSRAAGSIAPRAECMSGTDACRRFRARAGRAGRRPRGRWSG